ncbi:MAG: hypothetical protein J6V82_02435 [Clostridia bacterium]|nr:hypothetical protein [Clostridia bacterium]
MEDERVLFKFLGSLKKKWLLGAVALLGVVLIFFGASAADKGAISHSQTSVSDSEAYRKRLEEEIAALCAHVRGVGEVKVMVTLSSGEKTTVSGNRVTSTELPTVCGVAVVCEGGASAAVQAEISALVGALLGIGSHRIYVGALSK